MAIKSLLDLGLDINNNEHCKKYILEYEKNNQVWFAYNNSNWESCELIDVENKGLVIKKATLKTNKGKEITKEVKFYFPGEKRNKNYIYFTERREVVLD